MFLQTSFVDLRRWYRGHARAQVASKISKQNMHRVSNIVSNKYSNNESTVGVGETVDASRRLHEHISRILRPEGCTQHPFYDIVRFCATKPFDCIRFLCEWLLFYLSYVYL